MANAVTLQNYVFRGSGFIFIAIRILCLITVCFVMLLVILNDAACIQIVNIQDFFGGAFRIQVIHRPGFGCFSHIRPPLRRGMRLPGSE